VARLDLDGAAVTAVLGPTNTGKTHHALAALAGSRSGMIGLPLRLLAREAYERLRALKGDERVALVTGEEKRVPPGARWFACTVEAMPLDRPVEVVAVDEVQLCADRARGHVFTDRILRARGVSRTLLLGSDTVGGLVQALVPGVDVVARPRLSRLTHAPPARLTALPRRSAVVAFSVERVYALAERLKARHGGVAVVLGALSPRARNAQVAMYQAGEVPYLVATDAIGMGLNLDVDHVAFADLAKYDGRGTRALSPAELAQIAGRAGRFTRDGTFSTLAEIEPLPPDVIEAIEQHRFEPVQTAWWRCPTPDLSSVEALLADLERPPPSPRLWRMKEAEDHRALRELAAREEVRARATNPAAVALLWEVAQVPDFRKTLTDSHVELLAALYVDLVDRGRIDADRLGARLERLDRADGDLDALTTRLAWVRTWSYVAQRREWLDDAAGWQARTAALEDRLSDALHEALTARFVDRRLRLGARVVPVELDGDALLAHGEAAGEVRGLTVRLRPGFKVEPEVRAQIAALVAARAEVVLGCEDEALVVDADGALCHDGAPLARLEAGPSWREPRLRPLRHEWLEPAQRQAVAARLERWLAALLEELCAPLRREPALSTAARAVAWRVEHAGLCAPRREVEDALRALDEADRRALARLDLRVGRDHVFVQSRLKPRWVAARSWLDAVFRGARPIPPSPGGAVSVPADGRPADAWRRCGYVVAGPRAVRVDVAEAEAARLRAAARRGEPLDGAVASRLNVSAAEVEAVVRGLLGAGALSSTGRRGPRGRAG
jgi:ATP-dependent RNA helicase SUPV3L1/SUV3